MNSCCDIKRRLSIVSRAQLYSTMDGPIVCLSVCLNVCLFLHARQSICLYMFTVYPITCTVHKLILASVCPSVQGVVCTIASKINVTPKGAYLPISKLHSILAVANLLAHNNKSQICYCGQISLRSVAVNCTFSDTFGGNTYFAGNGI